MIVDVEMAFRACANYRARGYRLALDLRGTALAEQREAAVLLAPDWLQGHVHEIAAVGGSGPSPPGLPVRHYRACCYSA